ncbi:MAG TPA: PAS domain-containing protein, partial [Roseiflexaceae bacterium]|nr:PAS domain-containing protein [Roseiflexaceae bacterium]
MADAKIAPQTQQDELFSLVADIPWPTILLACDGRVLEVNAALCELLQVDADALVGRPIEQYVPQRARRQVRALVSGAGTGHLQAPLATELVVNERASVRVEVQANTLPSDPHGRLTLSVHQVSMTHRHTQLILALNRLAPALLAAQTMGEMFRVAARMLEPYGLGLAIWEPDPKRAVLRLAYTTPVRSIAGYLKRALGIELANYQVPRTTPGYKQALTEGRAIFWT